MTSVFRQSQMRWILGWVLLVAAPGMVVAAEFVEFYKNGVAAVESQNWTLAADMMRKAIAEQPKAKARVKKALYFRRYIPHFYLGQALYETGDCTGAFSAWQKSESQGIVQRFPEFQQLQEGREACGQMVGLQSALDEALRAVEGAETAATQARRQLSVLPGGEPGVQELVGRQTEAEASLGQVRSRLDSGEIPLGEVEQAATVAAVARKEFLDIRNRALDLGAAKSEVRQEEMTAEIVNLMGRARAELRASEYLQPYPVTIERRRGALMQTLERGQAASSTQLSIGELDTLRSELIKVTSDLRRAVSPPPAELQQAADEFLAGNYADVVAILEASEFKYAKARSHSHLLQAAAFFSMYYSTGAQDKTWLDKAGASVLDCHSADPQRSPPATFFSPSFVAFFEGQIRVFNDASLENGGEEGP